MTLRQRLAALAVALVAPLGLLMFSANPASAVTATVCASQSWGSGWFETNNHWDPTRCGNPTDNKVYNIVDLTSWYNVPLGSSMTICAFQQGGPPVSSAEWTTLSQGSDPTSCGRPAYPTTNVQTVRRTALGTPVINAGGIVSLAPDGRYHSGTVVAIYGVNFYPGDTVTVVPQGGQGIAASLVYDNADLRGQINAQLPALPLGSASVYVTNMANKTSASSPIFIT